MHDHSLLFHYSSCIKWRRFTVSGALSARGMKDDVLLARGALESRT